MAEPVGADSQYAPRVARTLYLLKRTERAAFGALYDALRDVGLTPSQYGVLQALVRLQRASSAQLARACFVTPQAMTGLIAGLERNGYIVRKPRRSPRIIEARVTALGQRVFADATERVERVEADMIAALPAREVERLQRSLARCADTLERRGRSGSELADTQDLEEDRELEPEGHRRASTP